MSRFITILSVAILILLVAVDPVLAGNKFTKIGGGVAGSNIEKIQILKTIGAIFGGFLIIMGVVSILTKNRFEGVVGMVPKKKTESVTVIPFVFIILGSLALLLYFL